MTSSSLIYFIDCPTAQTVTLCRAFRDLIYFFIYLCFLFFYERKGVARAYVIRNKLARAFAMYSKLAYVVCYLGL